MSSLPTWRKLRILLFALIVTCLLYRDLSALTNATLSGSSGAINESLHHDANSSPTSSSPDKPLHGWIYEPKNLNHFWNKMGDRPFQRTLYSKFGSFHRILDVGVRGYNRHCRDYIRQSAEDIAAATNTTNIYSSGSHNTINNNNKTIIYPQYYQMEPFPPNNETLNNDGLLQCYLHQVPHKYPNMKHSFDLIIDFGVFGWDAVQSSFSEEDVRRYIQSVLFLLKEKTKSDTYNGLWVLKVDRGWVANQEEFFKEFILPYFHFGRFEEWESGYALKNGNFRFYFLYRK